MKSLTVSVLRRLLGAPRALVTLFRRLGAWLRADAGAKVISLLAAVVVFYLVHTEGQEERSLWIRVEPNVFGGNQTISEVSPADVRVTVRGPSDRVLGIVPDEMRLRVGRPPRHGETEVSVRLRRTMLRWKDGSRALPDSVRVVSFEPRTISMSFDEEVQCEFPIDLPRITGRPAIPSAATSVSFADVPNLSVTVKGPSRVLQPLLDTNYHLRTDPVNINDRSQSFETTVRVNPAEEIRSLLRESDYEVRVRVSINEDTDQRVFPGVPVLLAAPSDGQRLFSGVPTNVDVRVTGPKSLVARIRPEHITALAFCGEADAGGVSRPVEVSLAGEFRQLRAVSLTPEVSVTAEDIVREAPPAPSPDVVVIAPDEDGAADAESAPGDGEATPADVAP